MRKGMKTAILARVRRDRILIISSEGLTMEKLWTESNCGGCLLDGAVNLIYLYRRKMGGVLVLH